MTRCSPTAGGVGSAGTNSVATAAATRSGGRGGCWNDGHRSGVVSHSGPRCHSVDDISNCVVIPLVSRSARLSRVGQYLQVAVGSNALISVMRWQTNAGSYF